MIEDKGILIKNIYYMLTYAFNVLKQTNYKNVETETFEHIEDLFAAILVKGIGQQLKQGLYKEYIEHYEVLPVLKGKLNVNGTIQSKLKRQQQLACDFDVLTENNLYNQILKSTVILLIRQPKVKSETKSALKKLMLFFADVDLIELKSIHWSRIRFQRNNQNYRMLLYICHLVVSGLLLTTNDGSFKMANFIDEQRMSRLYERFVLEYYRFHFPMLRPSSSQINWNLDDEGNKYLPIMQTDIMLKQTNKTLIIDTKYYGKTMQSHSAFNKETLHSSNLYQIFAYVKNYDTKNTGNVAGMLLYAKTQERITPDCNFNMSGNPILVKTLDISVSFSTLSQQLDMFVYDYFDLDLKNKKN